MESYTQTQTEKVPFEAPMYQSGNTMIYLTNPSAIMEQMELAFRSQWKDDEGNIHSVGKPLMNEEGISSVKGQVQAIVNQNTVMSNFDKREIPTIIDYLADTLALDLMLNRKKYDMTYTTRSKVYYIALTSAWACMKRAMDEGEKRFWKNTQREITSKVESNTGGGGIKRLFGWGR